MSETLKEKKERLMQELKDTETQIKEVDKFSFEVEKKNDGTFGISVFKGDEDGGQSFEMLGLAAKDLAKINIAAFNALREDVDKELKKMDFDDIFRDFNKLFPKFQWKC